MKHWALWIDIEGFSAKNKEQLYIPPLRNLADDLYKIGSLVYPQCKDCLYIYQFVDAFLIRPNFPEDNIEKPIAIATVLMRLGILRKYTTKSALSIGELSDIAACYSEEIFKKQQNGCISLGNGLMTLTPIMGTAIVKAHSLSENESGPLLIVDEELKGYINASTTTLRIGKVTCINWLSLNNTSADNILKIINPNPTSEKPDYKKALGEYIKENSNELTSNWIENAKKLLESA